MFNVSFVLGIEVSDLEVLEAHAAYSLSKEKSAAQFYIMKWNKSFDPKKAFALDSLVERSVPFTILFFLPMVLLFVYTTFFPFYMYHFLS